MGWLAKRQVLQDATPVVDAEAERAQQLKQRHDQFKRDTAEMDRELGAAILKELMIHGGPNHADTYALNRLLSNAVPKWLKLRDAWLNDVQQTPGSERYVEEITAEISEKHVTEKRVTTVQRWEVG